MVERKVSLKDMFSQIINKSQENKKESENINKENKKESKIKEEKCKKLKTTQIISSSEEIDDHSALEEPKTDFSSFYLENKDLLPASNSINNIQEVERFSFLENIRDKNGIKKNEENYDPTTLFIPEKFYNKFTPFEKQFWDIKKENFDTVIFFKKGKFYEMYENDADIAARLFDFRVTDRINMRMAGFPESSYDTWAPKFINHGYKIARVDERENQIAKKIREKEENVKKAKIIQRDLTEIITPATNYNFDCSLSPLSLFLAVIVSNIECFSDVCKGDYHFSVLLYDASVNNITTKSFCDSYNKDRLKTFFIQYNVKEVITNENVKFIDPKIVIKPDFNPQNQITDLPIADQLKNEREKVCLFLLYSYLVKLKREEILKSASYSQIMEDKNYMQLDGATIENMDILINNYDKTQKNSLFERINFCVTPCGQRKLYKWIVSPIVSLKLIKERRERVKLLDLMDKEKLKEILKQTGDAERILCRIKQNVATMKDLKRFLETFEKIVVFFEILEKNVTVNSCFYKNNFLEKISKVFHAFKLKYKIEEEKITPADEKDELFVLINEKYGVETGIVNYLEEMKKKFKIEMWYKSMNRDIYQIEVKSETKVPEEFELFSQTKKTKRFYTPELKKKIINLREIEEKIFQSQNSLLKRALSFFTPYKILFSEAIDYISEIDCYLSFNQFNENKNFVEPEINETNKLEVVGMTHPIYNDYISNDFNPKNHVSIITGPNMGGKSTFLRSLCLNIILAQLGLNVSCNKMKMPIFDKIFTRIGASDSLAKGESTFMMELNECSKILNNSTSKSFVVIDELGRGTSTNDGSAIARAVLAFMKKINCYTLFSTHYHSVVQEETDVDKLFVTCQIENDQIVFLYKLAEGICEESHGIYVAKLAGVPEEILNRAKTIRKGLLRKKNN
ncbi:DNA mismatch repair protein Msh6 [Nucleospora cyclopteri]